MSITRLLARSVAKPWGRRDLPSCFGTVADEAPPIGEIWFEDPAAKDRALLVKYLFTSERLSIQVHPDDAAARQAGYPRGKDEAWVVLAADDGAHIGIGLRERVSREVLRAAALSGQIVDLVDWRASSGGDVYYSPAGTVHALGPGLTIIEVQQNVDLTYRLYDYGRPRELHLDEGIAVAEPGPYVAPHTPRAIDDGRVVLADGPAFVLERWRGAREGTLRPADGEPIWVIPIAGDATLGGDALEPGCVAIVEDPSELVMAAGADMLIAYPAACRNADIFG